MFLQSALEAAFLLVGAFSPLLAQCLLLVSAHRVRIASNPEWIMGAACFSVAFLAFFSVNFIDPSTLTPYTLLGVTPTSTSYEITNAYDQRVRTAVSLGWFADHAQLTDAYETLMDPLQRCVYHRANGIPDWYGIPTVCLGEFAIDKLQAAKSFVPGWTDSKKTFGKMHPAIRSLRAMLARQGPSKRITEYSILEKEFWVQVWILISGMGWNCLNWCQQQVQHLPSAPLFLAGMGQWFDSGLFPAISPPVVISLVLVAILIVLYTYDSSISRVFNTVMLLGSVILETLDNAASPESERRPGSGEGFQASVRNMIGELFWSTTQRQG
ncbi:hypothetical protein C8A00DRAFT_32282 [Chaetomidium leptoderma]|uniref:Uncharacterized protein n=1 Tax=Chaetomidium leptoderma TaxID=669021 RepID=A0AAN6VPI8_9PEZI|nr:hypothetical protein C8A00DRAFT_32282 [Chaetomidium leptoderma]